jgi:hypothetical protein
MDSNSSNTFGSTHGSDPTGPHDSHLANRADPRIDSEHAGSFGNTSLGGLTGNATGGGLTSNTHSDHANSGQTGSSTGGSLTSNMHSDDTSGRLTGATHSHTHGSDPTGPHDSHLGNKADPRVDSDHIGSQGNVGTHSSHATQHATPSTIPTNPISGADQGIHSHQETDKTGVIGGHSDPFNTTQNTASESKSNTGIPSSGAGLTKQQGAANPTDEPTTGREKSAVKESKNEAEDFLKTKDPNDRSGEPMHMHTGAGDGSAVPKTQQERRESKVGNPGGQEHGRETVEGTGEQWVKTSGMAADGGDFDATKPGAGREADSMWTKAGKLMNHADMMVGLMEQKGIHKTEPGKPSEPVAETSAHGSHGSHDTAGKEKVPLTQKIKEKLHIGHKHE